jgi:hypothetical protein
VVADIKAGLKVVQFGNYSWKVLSVERDKALLITENIIDNRPYHSERVDITWENCSLRKYLNAEFYDSFSESDKKLIAKTHLVNEDSDYGPLGGNDTDDYIFLLSLSEAFQYNGDDEDLVINETDPWWWLRTPGDRNENASVFYYYGDSVGDLVIGDYGVRPTLYINLK